MISNNSLSPSQTTNLHLPTVVPAECIEYVRLLFCIKRCTSATSCDTEAEGVPIYVQMRV